MKKVVVSYECVWMVAALCHTAAADTALHFGQPFALLPQSRRRHAPPVHFCAQSCQVRWPISSPHFRRGRAPSKHALSAVKNGIVISTRIEIKTSNKQQMKI